MEFRIQVLTDKKWLIKSSLKRLTASESLELCKLLIANLKDGKSKAELIKQVCPGIDNLAIGYAKKLHKVKFQSFTDCLAEKMEAQ